MAIKRQIYESDNKINNITKKIGTEDKIITQVYKGSKCIYESFERFNVYYLACDGGFVENYKTTPRCIRTDLNLKERTRIDLSILYNEAEGSLQNISDSSKKASGFCIVGIDREGHYRELFNQSIENMSLMLPSSQSVEKDTWIDLVVFLIFEETYSAYVYSPVEFNDDIGKFNSLGLRESFINNPVGTTVHYTYDTTEISTRYIYHETSLRTSFKVYNSYDDMINDINPIETLTATYNEGGGFFSLSINISSTRYYKQLCDITPRTFRIALEVSYYDASDIVHTVSTTSEIEGEFRITPVENKALSEYFIQKNMSYFFTESNSSYRDLLTNTHHYILNKLTIYDVPPGQSPSDSNQVSSTTYTDAQTLWIHITGTYMKSLSRWITNYTKFFVITPTVSTVYYEFNLQYYNSNDQALSNDITHTLFPLTYGDFFNYTDLLKVLYDNMNNFNFDSYLKHTLTLAKENIDFNIFEFYVIGIQDESASISDLPSSSDRRLLNIFKNTEYRYVGLPGHQNVDYIDNEITTWSYNASRSTYIRKLFIKRKSLIFKLRNWRFWYWNVQENKVDTTQNAEGLLLSSYIASTAFNVEPVDVGQLYSPVPMKTENYPGEYFTFSGVHWYKDTSYHDISTNDAIYNELLNMLNDNIKREYTSTPVSDGYTYIPGAYHVKVNPLIKFKHNIASDLTTALEYYDLDNSITKEFITDYVKIWKYYNKYFNLHPNGMLTEEDYQVDFGGEINTNFIRVLPGTICYYWDENGNFFEARLVYYKIKYITMTSIEDLKTWLKSFDNLTLPFTDKFHNVVTTINFNGKEMLATINETDSRPNLQLNASVICDRTNDEPIICGAEGTISVMDGGNNKANVLVDIMSNAQKALQEQYNTTEEYTLHENYFLRHLIVEPEFSSPQQILSSNINFTPDLNLSQKYNAKMGYYLYLKITNFYIKPIVISEIIFTARFTEGDKTITSTTRLAPTVSSTASGNYLKYPSEPTGKFKATVKFYIEDNPSTIITREVTKNY